MPVKIVQRFGGGRQESTGRVRTRSIYGPTTRHADGSVTQEAWPDSVDATEPEVAEPAMDGRITPLGGGWFALPGGRRIRGREAAEKALAE